MIAIRALGFVNAPALFQRVVGEFQRNSVSIADYRKKRDFLYDTLMEAGFECVKPTGAFYMFPKSPLADEIEFVFKMQEEERILVVPGTGLRQGGLFPDRLLRAHGDDNEGQARVPEGGKTVYREVGN